MTELLPSETEIPIERFVYSVLPKRGLCIAASSSGVPPDTLSLRRPLDAGSGTYSVTLAPGTPERVVFGTIERSPKEDDHGRKYDHAQFAFIESRYYPALKGNLWLIVSRLSPVPNYEQAEVLPVQMFSWTILPEADQLLKDGLERFASSTQALLALVQGICATGHVVVTGFDRDPEQRVRLMEVLRLLMPAQVRPLLGFTTGNSASEAGRLAVQFDYAIQDYLKLDWRTAELERRTSLSPQSGDYAGLLDQLIANYPPRDILEWLDRARLPDDFSLGGARAAAQLFIALARAIPVEERRRYGLVSDEKLRAAARAAGDTTVLAEDADSPAAAKALLRQLLDGAPTLVDFQQIWTASAAVQSALRRYLPDTASLCEQLAQQGMALNPDQVRMRSRHAWSDTNYDVSIMAQLLRLLLKGNCAQCIDGSIVESMAAKRQPQDEPALRLLVSDLQEVRGRLPPEVASQAGRLADSVKQQNAASLLYASALLRGWDDRSIRPQVERFLRTLDASRRNQVASDLQAELSTSRLSPEDQLHWLVEIVRAFEWGQARAPLEDGIKALLGPLLSNALVSGSPARSLTGWRRWLESGALGELYYRVFESAARDLAAGQSRDAVLSLANQLRDGGCPAEARRLSGLVQGDQALQQFAQSLINSFEGLQALAPGGRGKSGWWTQLPESQMREIRSYCQSTLALPGGTTPKQEQRTDAEAVPPPPGQHNQIAAPPKRPGVRERPRWKLLAIASIALNAILVMALLLRGCAAPAGSTALPPAFETTAPAVVDATSQPEATQGNAMPEAADGQAAAASPAAQTSVSGAEPSWLEAWPQSTIPQGSPDATMPVTWSRDLRYAVFYGSEGAIEVALTGQAAVGVPLDARCNDVTSFVWAASGAEIWSCQTREVYARVPGVELISATAPEVIVASYLPRRDDEAVLVDAAGQLYSWFYNEGNEPLPFAQLPLERGERVLDLVWSGQPAGFSALTSSGRLFAWEEGADPEPMSLGGARLAEATWSETGENLAWIDRQGIVTVGLGNEEPRTILDATTASATALVWGPGSEQLLIGSQDGKILVWDRDTVGEAFETKKISDVALVSLAFSADGLYLAALAEDGTIYLGQLIGN